MPSRDTSLERQYVGESGENVSNDKVPSVEDSKLMGLNGLAAEMWPRKRMSFLVRRFYYFRRCQSLLAWTLTEKSQNVLSSVQA